MNINIVHPQRASCGRNLSTALDDGHVIDANA